MTSESSPLDATQPESRREDGTQGAATNNRATGESEAAAIGSEDPTRNQDVTELATAVQQPPGADGSTSQREAGAPESRGTDLPQSQGTAQPAAANPPAGESETTSRDATVGAASVDGEITQEPTSSRIAIEITPDAPRPPTPPSQRPKIARRSIAEPIGVTATLPPPAWPPRVVADVMTRKLITLREDEPIGDLERAMDRFQFHHVPVVTADMKLIGLITRTDLLHAKLGVRPDGAAIAPIDATTRADTLMRRNVVVARLDYSLTAACRVMVDNSLPCLPVVLEGGYLLGILTQSDVTRLALAVLEQQSQP